MELNSILEFLDQDEGPRSILPCTLQTLQELNSKEQELKEKEQRLAALEAVEAAEPWI